MPTTRKTSRRTVSPPGRNAPIRAALARGEVGGKKGSAAKAKPAPPKPRRPARLGEVVVADLMTSEPATVLWTASVGAALAKLHRLDVRHLPVVDEEGALVGMLSDRDFRPLPHDAASSRSPSPELPVSDLMSSDVLSVQAETSARELIDLLLDQKVGALPVTDSEGALVGIVSYIDVLRGLQGAFD